MWTAITVLWLLTLAVHKGYGYLPLDIQPQVFYVARGVEGMLLFLLLPYLAGCKLTRWQAHMMILCAIYGAAEEALTAICGTNYYFAAGHATFSGSRLCSGPAALNWITTTLLLATLLAMVVYEKRRISHG